MVRGCCGFKELNKLNSHKKGGVIGEPTVPLKGIESLLLVNDLINEFA
jgi:hypothetical protein